MHEYLESQICQEMQSLKSDVSHFDLHLGSLVAGVLPQQGNMQWIAVIGAHDTLIPVVLAGPKYNFTVFSLCTHPPYVERQLQYAMWARQRYSGQCLVRVMQSPYKAMANFGEDRFSHIIVMPGAEFSLVHDYCVNYLHDNGALMVAQRHPWMIDNAGLREVWRRYLKMTEAGYCIEDEKKAEWVVTVLKKS